MSTNTLPRRFGRVRHPVTTSITTWPRRVIARWGAIAILFTSITGVAQFFFITGVAQAQEKPSRPASGGTKGTASTLPGAPRLLPGETMIYVRIEDASQLREDMKESSVGRMMDDPKMRPMVTGSARSPKTSCTMPCHRSTSRPRLVAKGTAAAASRFSCRFQA